MFVLRGTGATSKVIPTCFGTSYLMSVSNNKANRSKPPPQADTRRKPPSERGASDSRCRLPLALPYYLALNQHASLLTSLVKALLCRATAVLPLQCARHACQPEQPCTNLTDLMPSHALPLLQVPLWVSLKSQRPPARLHQGTGATTGGSSDRADASGPPGGRDNAGASRTGGGGVGMGWAPLQPDAANDRKWLARRAAVKEVGPRTLFLPQGHPALKDGVRPVGPQACRRAIAACTAPVRQTGEQGIPYFLRRYDKQ